MFRHNYVSGNSSWYCQHIAACLFMPICCLCWNIGKLGVQWLVWSLMPLIDTSHPVLQYYSPAHVLWSILTFFFVVNHPFFNHLHLHRKCYTNYFLSFQLYRSSLMIFQSFYWFSVSLYFWLFFLIYSFFLIHFFNL